ncbi:hypothetical protein RB7655 [Rhodopirellula baltica SH 1]|uniref:Uncharacterized protein n=1 Tax=Rhodopirellula baltica (strain DSM 10527 / NCIMB 13988 / SH1) TaxID=243090 RepID=Q7UNC5_RHOBA|nr:hypothetical protein RB7655 [Rhodopirellula baltica SH 1]
MSVKEPAPSTGAGQSRLTDQRKDRRQSASQNWRIGPLMIAKSAHLVRPA